MDLRFENQNIEFKEEYTEDIRKAVIAFANAEGGTLYIGIRKDGTVAGLKNPDDVMLRVASSLRDSISPDIMPFVTIQMLEMEGKRLVELTVSPGTNRPYYLRDKGLRPSGVYIRRGSSSQPMTDEGIRELIRQTGGKSFEESRSLNQALSFDTFRAELEKCAYKLELPQMKTLKLIGEDGLYTNLAYIVSDQNESVTKVALFQGSDKAVFRDRQEFSGSVFKQLEEVYRYIDFHNKTKAAFSALKRIDTRDYPEDALREALFNAIIHRDYSFSAGNLVNIYDDRIEFVSVGGLVPGLELSSIFLGISASRNPNLAQIFFRMDFIESYGTGIGKMQRAYSGLYRQPVFETAPGVFRVTLPNRNECERAPGLELNDVAVMPIATDEKEAILEYAGAKRRLTRKDVEEILMVGSTKAFRLLKELCEEEKLLAVGTGKSTRYILK